MELRTGSVDFSQPLRGSGPRTASQTIVFPRTVLRAVAGIGGYTVAFSGGDHNVGRIEVFLDTSINDNTVTVSARLGLRDWSGDWDDDYDGEIQFVVVADLESATAPPPRKDVIVTDLELNQAVQFFRADTYLDPASVQPDNAIWLVSRKNTGVRVYVDYDSGAGLPLITNLTGQLVVSAANESQTLDPINPGGSITPRRDSAINMSVADHTLNFMIPAALCNGTATVQCQVWDQAAPHSKSAMFTRTLVFTDVDPLSIYLVGIHYKAVNPALDPPSQSDISGALIQLIKTYPVGDVIQVGYTTMDFSEDVTGNVANGCGSGFNHLLDRLNDLRGSSDDIYLGSLPSGIQNTPGNSIGGCAPQGGKVAGTFLDLTGDVPHEVGHCLNRQHAPCSSGCTPPPADPDSNYPQYGSFRSDSIGVFGFDATTNTVFDPASFSDFMAYHFPQWISAYTYNGLRGSNFQSTGAPSPGLGAGRAHLKTGVDINLCFLGLTIGRDRHVTRRESFIYPATMLGRGTCGAQFSAEFLDKDRQTLSCSPLYVDCDHLGCTCWPKTIRDQVPFPAGSRWLLIWEGDTKIYEEEIPDAPQVTITGVDQTKDGVVLHWQGKDPKPLWYLVHWYDDRSEEWRGVAPRLQDTSLLIPARLFTRRQALRVRVLATPGIATGIAETEVQLEKGDPGCPNIVLTGVDTSQTPANAPSVLHAAVIDPAGRELPNDRMTWYGGDGTVIGRGSQVDLRTLKYGRQTIRLVSRAGNQPIAAFWVVERTLQGFAIHHAQRVPTRGPRTSGNGKDDPSNPADPC